MSIYDKLIEKRSKLAVVGLGYVGMPLAIEFAKKLDVIGYDCNRWKVDKYISGQDVTNEVGDAAIKNTSMRFTTNPTMLKEAGFIIVAVPTPADKDDMPNLNPLRSASRTIGENISYGTIVVFESTVYPGVTQEVCVPIIEEYSGLTCGVDFKVGYSPERINPGDKIHRLSTITKIVSGMDEESLCDIARVYELIIEAGVYRAESIRVAEAAKVIENSQRDINIAFMNEIAMMFHKMGVDTKAALRAAGTKWNFMNFTPGLVGGHCIGIDPYYLTYRSKQLGYSSQIISAGRKINNYMGRYCGQSLIKQLIDNDISIKHARVAILGFTFKENCPDVRNTKVIDIVNELKGFGVDCIIVDPVADAMEANSMYGIKLTGLEELEAVDGLMIAVSHEEFRQLTKERLKSFYADKDNTKVLCDIKGIYDRGSYTKPEWDYWSL